MKKLIISCAVLFTAGLFASCNNDPNAPHCWEVTVTVNMMGMSIPSTSYVWCTESELEAEKQALKDQQREFGLSEDLITVTSKRSNKSESDCH